ncbi:hypothetical protein N7454_006609 [Penicillium verhagenii]|nr:hypothetical protein N7454_006609 [Penicillium verhagenii]
MNSPPKRRKSGNKPGTNAGALRSALPIATKSSRRPSFQSPTRSSLAKSNPGALEHAISRSPSRQPEPQQSKGEKEGLNTIGLRGRKAFRPSISGTSSPLKAPPGNAHLLSPSRRASGVQSFTKPPRRLSKKIVPGDFFFGSPIRKQTQPPEQDLSNTPEGQLATELGSATRETAAESHIYTGLDGATDDNYDNDLEPELPPTPTQLGLEKAPDWSIGPLSSSPSGRYEKRMKRKATDTFQRSPLKTLKFQSQDLEEISDSDTSSVGEELSAAALEKRKLHKSLKAELRYLKDDVAELMEWTEKLESDINLKGGSKEFDHFLSLLSEESSYINRPVPRRAPVPLSSILSTLLPFSKNISRPTHPTSPLPTNPFALKDSSQSPSYLTVFAPLALHTHTSRRTLSKTNPVSQCVISVSVPTGIDSKKRRVPEVLRRWIDARLASSLLKLDVATLCWGIHRYWEASVARARLWARIDHKYGTVVRKTKFSESQTGVIGIPELQRLIPHLERSSLVVKSKSPAGDPRVLLSNALTIDDWTGEPQLRPELSVSTSSSSGVPSKKIDQEAKKLFHALLREDKSTPQSIPEGVHFCAVIRATEGTLGALFGHD